MLPSPHCRCEGQIVKSSWHKPAVCKGTWHRHAKAFAASPWHLQLQWPRKAHTTSHLKSCQHLLKFLPKVPPSSTSILSLVLNSSCYFTSFTFYFLLSWNQRLRDSSSGRLHVLPLPTVQRHVSATPPCYKCFPSCIEARTGKGRENKPAWPSVASPSNLTAHEVKRRGKERNRTLHRTAQHAYPELSPKRSLRKSITARTKVNRSLSGCHRQKHLWSEKA